jgi:hypothetical protein
MFDGTIFLSVFAIFYFSGRYTKKWNGERLMVAFETKDK